MKATKRKKSSAANTQRPASKKPAVKAANKPLPPQRKKAASPSPSKAAEPVKGGAIVSSPFWNIWDAGDEYKVRISVPGLSKKDIKLGVNGNNLIISSDTESQNEKSKKNYIAREYSYSSWSRTISLPEKVDPEDIKIRYKDGVLKLDLPKSGK
ncbi:MAG: Hsp20/alpha crystallin family protein [Bacteroidota bacterium]|nr:Hsp20/alpha crystallin family protein [Bacteroidota bacterium]